MINKLFLFQLLFFTFSLSQSLSEKYIYSFDLRDASIDSSLGESIRRNFEDDDGKLPLKSIAVDLNDDGVNEKLVPNEYLGGSGGCPWLVYSQTTKVVIGEIGGKVIYIDSKKVNGYHIIETYWRGAAGDGSVYFYECKKGKFVFIKKIDLHDDQINKYFEKKKALGEQ